MTLYLDASVLVPLFIQEAGTAKADARVGAEVLVASDFAAAEFSAAVARRVRVGDVTRSEAASAFADFDEWAVRAVNLVPLVRADMIAAVGYIRRLDIPLRAPDALHIAIAQRLGAMLFTFDKKMADAAEKLGIPVET